MRGRRILGIQRVAGRHPAGVGELLALRRWLCRRAAAKGAAIAAGGVEPPTFGQWLSRRSASGAAVWDRGGWARTTDLRAMAQSTLGVEGSRAGIAAGGLEPPTFGRWLSRRSASRGAGWDSGGWARTTDLRAMAQSTLGVGGSRAGIAAGGLEPPTFGQWLSRRSASGAAVWDSGGWARTTDLRVMSPTL